MSKREEFIAAINILSAAAQSITAEQRIGLLQQAVQQYGLSTDDANEILKASGLVVGERANYFEVLGLSIDDLQDLNENIIANNVDKAHKKLYSESLRAGGLPRSDGRTQEQWRTVLNQARDTLIDPQKRGEHIATLQTQISHPVDFTLRQEFPTLERTSLGISTPEEMLLIPVGEFQMGSNSERTKVHQKSINKVYVDAFYMDKYAVTNAQYKIFIDANPLWGKPTKRDDWNRVKKILSIFGKYHDGNYLKHWDGNNFPTGKDDHPVTHISWYAAMAYAQWAGKRLPTEAEWEKAARGGLTGQKYPWGDLMDSNMVFCGKDIGETTSVGKYPPNNYGLHDMVGNVWEWCLDEYAPNYYNSSPDRNPVAGVNTKEDLGALLYNFRNVTTDRILRGGSLFTSSEPIQTAIRRGRSPLLTVVYSTKLVTSNSTRFAANIGFRCAWDTQLKSNLYHMF